MGIYQQTNSTNQSPYVLQYPANYILSSIKNPTYNSSNDTRQSFSSFNPNRPSSDANALSLFLIHSFRPASSLGGSPPPDVVVAPPPGNNASMSTWIAIPIAVSMEAIVIPCSLNSVQIFSPNEVSLSNTLAIVSLKLVI